MNIYILTMIDARIGNPKIQIEIAQDYFKRFGITDFTSSQVPFGALEYQFEDYRKYDDIIRKYYKYVLDQPIPQDKSIIIAQGTNGSTAAVLYAISKLMKKNVFDPLKIFQINKPPTYNLLYNTSLTIPNCIFNVNGLNLPNDYDDYYFNSNSIMYTGNNLKSGIINNSETCDISVAISPNNPTGEIINERYGNFQIIDCVYDLPLFTNENTPVNRDITGKEIFVESFSKLGFASYRFGWAITSDPMIPSLANNYARFNHNGMITPSYFATDKVINSFIETGLFSNYSQFNYNTFQSRKNILKKIFIKNNIFIPEYNQNYAPYSFIPISRKKFRSIGIDSRDGQDFFMSNDYSRLNLMIDTNSFNQMVKILEDNIYKIL